MATSGPPQSSTNISQSLLLTSLTNYYNRNPENRQILFDIIQGKSKLSLRILDWFVTHYAKNSDILYWIDEREKKIIEKYPDTQNDMNLRKFHLYLKYRAELQSYTKMFFDPFRRHERITFILETEPALKTIETTIGQLNFFRWTFQNHVLVYIESHLDEIEEHMASYQKEIIKNKLSGGTKEKKSNGNRNTIMQVPSFIRFD